MAELADQSPAGRSSQEPAPNQFHDGLAQFAQTLRRRAVPEPLYDCICKDTGWIELEDGTEYETEGPRSHHEAPRPKHGVKAIVTENYGAVRPCPRCRPNGIPEVTSSKVQRRDGYA